MSQNERRNAKNNQHSLPKMCADWHEQAKQVWSGCLMSRTLDDLDLVQAYERHISVIYKI